MSDRRCTEITRVCIIPVKHKVFQYDFIPQFTQWCDLCEKRCGKGKKPTCVQHCQAQCLDWGPIEELAAKVDSPKQMIVAINEA